MFVPDTNVALGIMGIVAVLISSMELLNLFLIVTPTSVVLDCIKLGVVARPKGFGFLVLVEVCLMAIKLVGTYFAYTLKKSQEDAATSVGGGSVGTYQPYQPPAQPYSGAQPYGGQPYGAPNAAFNPEQGSGL